MQRVRALGLDETTTQQIFEIFDAVMASFAVVRKDYGSHEGLRNVVAVAIFDIVSSGERNRQMIEFHAENAGRQYLKKLRL